MSDVDYVLGTHEEEIARLFTQHRAWRAHVWTVWRQAGFGAGQTILDVGSGPGCAALELAELVGPEGQVVAMERSQRFLLALGAEARRRGLANIRTHELDLDVAPLPNVAADAAWCRWVLTFVREPRALVTRVAQALKPGGVFVIHEYFDYSTWRGVPVCPELEEFVSLVMGSWREAGGEADIAVRLPPWLEAAGFTIRSLRPIVEIVPASDLMWLWLRTFVEVGSERLVELGHLTRERAATIRSRCRALEGTPGARMITPGVLEIVAVRA